jgi:capsular polysaccharide biosynthesis protein
MPDKDPTLRDLLRIFHRRKRAIVVTVSVVFLLSICACVFMTRRYTATGVIQLEKSSSDSLGLDSLMGAASGGASDALSVNIDLQTQASILQSDALALKVVKDLNLEANEDFKPHFSPIGWLTAVISPRGPADPPHASLENSPGRRATVTRAFARNLKVKVTAGTRLLEVDFTNRDPKVAAAVVNHLVQALIDYTFQTKFNATNQVSQWLEGQLGDLRKQSEQLQARVVSLQQGSGIFGVGGTDPQGKPVIYSAAFPGADESRLEGFDCRGRQDRECGVDLAIERYLDGRVERTGCHEFAGVDPEPAIAGGSTSVADRPGCISVRGRLPQVNSGTCIFERRSAVAAGRNSPHRRALGKRLQGRVESRAGCA